MKNLLIALSTIVLAFLTTKESCASHMMGGQITLKPIQGLSYLVTYTAYRDTVGIPIQDTAYLKIVHSPSTIQFTQLVQYNHSNVILIPGGAEQYTYSDTIVFPFPGDWRISYEECCRNLALLNISPNCHYFYADVKIDSVNATPEFLNLPIVLAQIGVPFYYNPLPFDQDGDSIAWELEIPLDCNGWPSGNYTLPSSDTLFPFTLDSVTGEITFLPNLIGHFQVSAKVQEYRNGLMIGSISRDMQIIVEQSMNIPSNLILNSNIPTSGNKTFQVASGSAINISVNVYDPDNQNVSITATGEPFLLSANPAQTVINNGLGSASFTFTWTPDSNQARQAPYLVGYRVSENYGTKVFQNDISFAFRIANYTTAVENIEDINTPFVFPNPATGITEIQFRTLEGGPAEIEIFNSAGMLVAKKQLLLHSGGFQIVRLDVNPYQSGSYFLNISHKGKNIGQNRLVIAH